MPTNGKALKLGYEVKTGNNSQMDIRFHNDMAIRVSENSIVRIDNLTVKNVLLDMKGGSLYGKFEKLFKEYNIKIKTPTTIAAVRGTELGFEIEERSSDEGKEKKMNAGKRPGKSKATAEDEDREDAAKTRPEYLTTVYSLSGITELYNPKFEDKKVLLSYQNKLSIPENDSPTDPEKLTADDVAKIRSILNSIHTDEVLFISDKINFETGSAKILQNSYDELDKIVKIINEKRVRIRIEGHTDNQGSAAFNQALSIKRADSIKLYFMNKGINPELLETAGYGSSKPIASNKTKEGMAMNRRVEFIVIE
jgi:outer membrane protein OmpA-like peptidoglycan-associated protein